MKARKPYFKQIRDYMRSLPPNSTAPCILRDDLLILTCFVGTADYFDVIKTYLLIFNRKSIPNSSLAIYIL